MSAGIWEVYGGGIPLPPMVDHPHERIHQHQDFLRLLAHRNPDPKRYPNHPDVDIRDAGTHYLIDIEVPGVKNVGDIHCTWTSSSSLVVTGETVRPGESSQANKGEEDASSHNVGPFLLIGERRIGYFKRMFNLPVEAEMDKLTAKLEAGLLCLKVPKKAHLHPKGDGKVKIDGGI